MIQIKCDFCATVVHDHRYKTIRVEADGRCVGRYDLCYACYDELKNAEPKSALRRLFSKGKNK